MMLSRRTTALLVCALLPLAQARDIGHSHCDIGLNSSTPGAKIIADFIANTSSVLLRLPLQVRRSDEGTGKVAVLIEPREHPCVAYVVRNVMHYLGGGWALQIFHGSRNLKYLRQQLDVGSKSNITFTALPVHNFDTLEYYSQFVASRGFWEQIRGETVLMFQTDALLLRRGVEEFLSFDYVGAPWLFCNEREQGDARFYFDHRGPGSWCWLGGNGGLSLRRKSRMLSLLHYFKWPGSLRKGRLNPNNLTAYDAYLLETKPEDVFFTVSLQDPVANATFPPRQLALRFAAEGFTAENEQVRPFGLHKAWLRATATQMSAALEDSAKEFDALHRAMVEEQQRLEAVVQPSKPQQTTHVSLHGHVHTQQHRATGVVHALQVELRNGTKWTVYTN